MDPSSDSSATAPGRSRPPPFAELVLPPSIEANDVSSLCAQARHLLECTGAPVLLCDVGAVGAPALTTVDALARLQLTARRLGRNMRLRRPSRRLLGLLLLTGLTETSAAVTTERGPPGRYVDQMDVVEVARSLQPFVRAHADAAERDRRLAPPVVEAMASNGLFRMAAPAVYGGLEVDPVTMIRALEAVSEADGATGWTLMIGVETVGIAMAALAPATARAMLGERPDIVFSGAINPLGRAVEVEGGLVVNGRWPYASGCENADYFWGGCLLTDRAGVPRRTATGQRIGRQVVVPRRSYDVMHTWEAAGLCGSGSHDVVVADVFVPDDHVTDLYGTGMRVDTPLYRLPIYSRLAFNKIGVATGVARTALAAFEELATAKTPFMSSELLRERPQAQLAMAEAEARLGAARAYAFELVDLVWSTTCDGREVSKRDQARLRLACSHCCAEAVRAVEIVYAQAGITASFPSSPLERAIRDVRVVPQHTMVAPTAIAAAGRVLLGLEPGTAIF